jgi:hypothetical protein
MTTTSAATRPQETPEGDRVRTNTAPEVLASLDQEARERVRRCADAGHDALTRRIEEVEQESDIERVLEANASALALIGLAAGVFLHRRFLLLTAVVLSFLLQHALQGWCPPLPLFRRMGIRSRQEIDAEKAALKALRGDYHALREGAVT